MPRVDATYAESVVEQMRVRLKKRGAVGFKGLWKNFKICDSDGSEMLKLSEFSFCLNNLCKLGLSPPELKTLFDYFDTSGDGLISLDEFVKAVRGRMSADRRKLVVKCFEELDKAGDGSGDLSVGDIQPYFCIANDPRFLSGEKTEAELLQEFVDGFESGNGESDGVIGLEEWVGFYENISAGIDDDDQFGVMLAEAWSALKTRDPNGDEVPAIQYVCEADIDTLEKILKKNIFQKSVGTNEQRALKAAFKRFDLDNSGEVNFHEFTRAMQCFGLDVQQKGQKGSGGVPPAVLRGLFDRYNPDKSECVSFTEFADGLFTKEAEDQGYGGPSLASGANLTLPGLMRDFADPGHRPGQRFDGKANRVPSAAHWVRREVEPRMGPKGVY